MKGINNLPDPGTLLKEITKIKSELANGAVRTSQHSVSFGDVLKNAIENVNKAQVEADNIKTRFELNDPSVSISDVMLKTLKANVFFQLGLQARNKLVSAYKEIMNMPV